MTRETPKISSPEQLNPQKTFIRCYSSKSAHVEKNIIRSALSAEAEIERNIDPPISLQGSVDQNISTNVGNTGQEQKFLTKSKNSYDKTDQEEDYRGIAIEQSNGWSVIKAIEFVIRRGNAPSRSKETKLTRDRLQEHDSYTLKKLKRHPSPYYYGVSDPAFNVRRDTTSSKKSFDTSHSVGSLASYWEKVQKLGMNCFVSEYAQSKSKTESNVDIVICTNLVTGTQSKLSRLRNELSKSFSHVQNTVGHILPATQTIVAKSRRSVLDRPRISGALKPAAAKEECGLTNSVVETRTDAESKRPAESCSDSYPEKEINDFPAGDSEQMQESRHSYSRHIEPTHESPPALSAQDQLRNTVFLWADKHRPKSLEDFICNKEQAQTLRQLISPGRCPHLIFQGAPGVGKRSLVLAMLQEIFGSTAQQIRKENQVFKLKGEHVTKIIVPVTMASSHIEINLNSLGGYERHVIMTLIKDMHRLCTTGSLDSVVDYRVIVLREADKLSSDAQHYVRWLMDRYQDTCKLIFICSNASRLQSIRSLCKVITVDSPTSNQIVEVLQHIAHQEQIELPPPLAKRIVDISDNNLRQAIRCLEACWRSQYPFVEDQKILTGWEEDIAEIARNIIDEQSPKQLYNIRGKLQKLIMHNVCPNFVFSTLLEELKQHLDENLLRKAQNVYDVYTGKNHHAESDGEPLTGNRGEDMIEKQQDPSKRNALLFVRIEEFTARFMSVYKAAKGKDKGH